MRTYLEKEIDKAQQELAELDYQLDGHDCDIDAGGEGHCKYHEDLLEKIHQTKKKLIKLQKKFENEYQDFSTATSYDGL